MALLVFPNSYAKRIKEHRLWNYFNEELCPGCSRKHVMRKSCVRRLIYYANLYEWVITMTYHSFRAEKCNLGGNTGGRSGLSFAKIFSPPKFWNIFAPLHFCLLTFLKILSFGQNYVYIWWSSDSRIYMITNHHWSINVQPFILSVSFIGPKQCSIWNTCLFAVTLSVQTDLHRYDFPIQTKWRCKLSQRLKTVV